MPETVEKFFISLTLPEGLRVRLAKTRDDVSKRLGGLVGRPMNPNKYHITLAVVPMPPNFSRDLWNEITTDLVHKVQSRLDCVKGKLCVHLVGKFGNGAVFLEVEDLYGALWSLRKTAVEVCQERDLVVAESDCFHITLFR